MSLPNFHKVSDELYRGGQPDRRGFEDLTKMVIRTTINLRSFHTDYFYLRGLPLVNHHLWMKAWHPEYEDIRQFLTIMAVAKLKGELPVCVHCALGSERTGAIVASYRVKVQGWSKEEAIREMTGPDFGFDPIRGYFMTDFIKKL